MRKLIAVLVVLAAGASAQAQQNTSAAGSDWQRVQALPSGTSMHIAASPGHSRCSLKSVTDDALICSRISAKDLTFQRSDIRTIKLTRRGASAALGAAIGAGAGAAIGVGVFKGSGIYGTAPKAAALGAVIGAVVSAPIGFATDFLAGPTVYRAP